MKINKYISIDEEIFKQLSKETNASDLINNLLIAHYNIKNCQSLEILKQKYSEIKLINKENRKKEKEFKFKIDKLCKKNKEFFSVFKQAYPQELLEKLKSIENLDYEAALELSKKFDLHNRGIGGVKLIKIWEEVRNNDLGKQ